jgi:hypothetical protein
MGIEVMSPQEKRPVATFTQPLQRQAGHVIGTALGEMPFPMLAVTRKAVVVKIETLRQTETVVDGKRAENRSRFVSFFFQEFGEGDVLGGEYVSPVVPYPVLVRIESRQHRGVRRQGDRHWSEGLLEKNSLGRDSIQIRSCLLGKSVTGKSILAGRVEAQEYQIERSAFATDPVFLPHLSARRSLLTALLFCSRFTLG